MRYCKSKIVIWNILRLFLSVDKMDLSVWLNKLSHFGIEFANHVKPSKIVAIRKTFCTNYFEINQSVVSIFF